jgi:hypothetical protein
VSPVSRAAAEAVAHPLGSLTPVELRARAATAVPQVIAMLPGPGVTQPPSPHRIVRD